MSTNPNYLKVVSFGSVNGILKYDNCHFENNERFGACGERQRGGGGGGEGPKGMRERGINEAVGLEPRLLAWMTSLLLFSKF